MTTLYGAVLGRAPRAPVAHIESGLRSFDLLHPFPEELNRSLTSRIATICYAPGAWAPPTSAVVRWSTPARTRSAMPSGNGRTANAGTARASRWADSASSALHRFELLNERRLLRRRPWKRSRLESWPPPAGRSPGHGRGGRRTFRTRTSLRGRHMRPIPRLDFFGFVATMRRSSFLVTDSGGKPGGELLPRPSVPRPPQAHRASRRARRDRCALGLRTRRPWQSFLADPHASADEVSSRPVAVRRDRR